MTRSRSLCRGKSVKKPNKCKKVRGCKVASGKKRTFCRKSRNHTKKNKKQKQ
jgi:hypothetical protein